MRGNDREKKKLFAHTGRFILLGNAGTDAGKIPSGFEHMKTYVQTEFTRLLLTLETPKFA